MMNVKTGIVVGRRVDKNRGGSRDVLLLQVQITDVKDVQTVELMQGSGDQYNPENGSKVLIISNGPSYRIAIAVDDLVFTALEVGERAIRAVLNGQVKSSVHCKVDGDTVLNSGTNFAARFNELESEFDELNDKFNSHLHPFTGTGTVQQTLQQSNADISQAKSETVRLP